MNKNGAFTIFFFAHLFFFFFFSFEFVHEINPIKDYFSNETNLKMRNSKEMK